MTKDDIYAKAEKLGIKKENLEAGLKNNKSATEKMVNEATSFIAKKGK